MGEGLILLDVQNIGVYVPSPSPSSFLTLRRNQNVSTGEWGAYILTGDFIYVSENIAGVTSDNNDLTGAVAQKPSGTSVFVVGLTTAAIPSGHIVRGVSATYRLQAQDGG